MKARELRQNLFGNNCFYPQFHCIEQILKAYSDSHDELEEERDLDFFCKYACDGDLAIEIAHKCIKSYNAFDSIVMTKVVSLFGSKASYFFARESSVCVYVKPNNGIRLEKNWMKILKADEFSYNSALGMFRIWWD